MSDAQIQLEFGRVGASVPRNRLFGLFMRRWAVEMHEPATDQTRIIDGLWADEFSARVWRDLLDADRRRFKNRETFRVVRYKRGRR